jgi:vacuolar-type H+-ATPase subunit I/STV1
MECPNCKTILLSNTDIKKLDTLSKRHFTKLEKLNEKLKIQKNKIYDFKKLNNIKNGFVAGGWCSS